VPGRLHARLGANALEMGYWVHVRHANRGVGTLAAAVVTDLAFGIAGITTVEIHHDQANSASAAIPAKLGYQHVMTVPRPADAPGESGIEWQWRMTRDAWPTSSGAQRLATTRAAS
jgi:ribosomal-protein-serine acetyltransferase